VFEIARGMKSILFDAALRERLIARGLKQVAKFSWRIAAERVLDAYNAVSGTEKVRATAAVVTNSENSL